VALTSEDILALARRLVRLDPRRGHKFLPRLLRQLSELFDTDRVSVMLLDLRKQRFSRALYTGFSIPTDAYNESNLVSLHAVTRAVPLVTENIRLDYPELVGPFADTYKTDACACFPMVLGDDVIGVISVSNLRGVAEIKAGLPDIELLIGVITQIVSVLELPEEETPRSGARQIREVREFARKLEGVSGADEIVQLYSDTIFEHYDGLGLFVLVDAFDKEQLSWMALSHPMGRKECRRIFDKISAIWSDKKPGAKPPDFASLRIVSCAGLTDGDTPVRTSAIKVFPLVIEKRLFGIVGAAIEHEADFSEEHLDLFNLLTFQFAVSLRNNLLDRRHLEAEENDRLTGLYNPRQFEQFFAKEFERSRRYSVPLVLLMVDIDHYREISDTYGYDRASFVIKEISGIIKANSRTSDVISRIAEDKFALLLPETNLKQAELQADRIRSFIANHSFFSCESKLFIKATASLGIASFIDHKPDSPQQLVEFADTALYFAKKNGRNRVVSYSFVLNLFLKESGGMV